MFQGCDIPHVNEGTLCMLMLIARSKGWTQSVLKVAKFSAQNSGAQLDIQLGEGAKRK